MDNKVNQYQRAVTPTLDSSNPIGGIFSSNTSSLRGKVLNYTSNQRGRPPVGVGVISGNSLQFPTPSNSQGKFSFFFLL